MRGADQRGFVSDSSGAIRESHGLTHALHTGPGDQQLLGRGILCHPFPKLYFFLAVEQNALTCRTAHHVPPKAGTVPLLDIVLYFFFPDLAFVIKGSRDRRENSVQLHKREQGGPMRAAPKKRLTLLRK